MSPSSPMGSSLQRARLSWPALAMVTHKGERRKPLHQRPAPFRSQLYSKSPLLGHARLRPSVRISRACTRCRRLLGWGKAELAAYSAKLELGCHSTLSSEALAAAPPGRSVVASCPSSCDGPVFGSFIYAPESSICAAAAHAGLIAEDGGSVVVTVGYGQEFYFGSVPP